MSDKTINATLKAGSAYDAPWITVGGDSEAEVAFKLRAIGADGDGDLMSLVASAGKALQGYWTASDQLGAQAIAQEALAQPVAPANPWESQAPAPAFVPQQQQFQQQPAQPQGQPVPQCAHGPRQFRTSKPGAGKPWSAWMCPTPKGTPGQCEPQWIR